MNIFFHKSHKHLNWHVLISVLLSFSISQTACSKFPSYEFVDKRVSIFKQKKAKEEKIQVLVDLLEKISNPKTAENDAVINYTFGKLKEEFRSGNENIILNALDLTTIDGGFANNLCSFYSNFKNNKIFIERYSEKKNHKSLKRCVGLSFSKDEIETILRIKPNK